MVKEDGNGAYISSEAPQGRQTPKRSQRDLEAV